MLFFWKQRSKIVILPIFDRDANLNWDNSRRVVWLGRHPIEKISIGPNDKLIYVGNVEWSAMAKACLTVFRKARNAEVKAGHNEPLMIFNGSQL